MAFPEQLLLLRRHKGLTQKALTDLTGLSVIQIHRYENGASQPTFDAIRNLALTLGVSSDELVFDEDERGPSDELKLQFEAVSQFDVENRRVAKDILDGLILKNQAKRLAASGSQT